MPDSVKRSHWVDSFERAVVAIALSLTLVFYLVGFFVNEAYASTMIVPTADAVIEKSAVIARGRVDKITSVKTGSGIITEIRLRVLEAFKGTKNGDFVHIQERGGRVGDDFEFYPGTPEYKVNQEVLVFLSLSGDGRLRTAFLDAGKVPVKSQGQLNLGTASSHVVNEMQSLKNDLAARYLSGIPKPDRSAPEVRTNKLHGVMQSSVEFRFMGGNKWKIPARIFIDPRGDSAIGPEKSLAASLYGIEAWNSTGSQVILKQLQGPSSKNRFACVPGELHVIFNDPSEEIENPVDCQGVLAVGGFCGDSSGGISGGSVVFNNGWGSCFFWDHINMTEVMTHELGHAIGLAHSWEGNMKPTSDPYLTDATMYWMAHFDGRGNGLREYDIGAVKALYGVSPTPAPTPTPTRTPTPPPTPTPTPTLAPALSPSPTPTESEPPIGIGPSGCTKKKKRNIHVPD